MPSSCSALKCSNTSNQGYTLVTYPRVENLKSKWIAAVGRGKNWSPNNSQRLCEIHFQPSEIEFVAGRKRVKFGSVPSRFCTCSSEDQENCLRSNKKRRHLNSIQEELMIDTSIAQLLVKEQSSEGSEQIINMAEHHYNHVYSTSERRPLTVLAVNNIFYEKRCLTNKKVNLVQHQYNCVQICKPLTIEDIQSDAESQEIEGLDGIQPMNENENLLRSIVSENEQLQNKMEETVKDTVKVNKKLKEMDVEDRHKKIYEENCAIKQHIQILSKSLQLTRKVLAKDQLQALEAGYSKGFKWSKETILKALGLRLTCGSVPSRFCTCSSEDRENQRKLRTKQKDRRIDPYQRQSSVGKHNDCCIIMQPAMKKNGILADKQEELIEEVRRENDMLRTVVSLLKTILQNRK